MITNNQWGLNYQANDTPLQFSDTHENPRAAAGLHSPQAHYKPATPARCSRTYSVQPPLLPECSQRRYAAVYKPDFDTGSVDIERTGNNFLIHNSVLLKLFLFSWASGL